MIYDNPIEAPKKLWLARHKGVDAIHKVGEQSRAFRRPAQRVDHDPYVSILNR